MRRVRASVVLIAMLGASCSSGDDASSAAATTTSVATAVTTTGTATLDDVAPSTTSEMRPVPTVAPSTDPDPTVELVDDGVVEISPTVVPPAPGSDPEGGPVESTAPPSTEFVGDPQPTPGTTEAAPPPTVEPLPAACDRLVAVGVADEIAASLGTIGGVEVIAGADGCRYDVGAERVEVWFVSLDEVRGDWFRRAGIEPVALAGGDAVGLAGFRSPSGDTGTGYTVATVGGAQGVIVSVESAGEVASVTDLLAALAAEA